MLKFKDFCYLLESAKIDPDSSKLTDIASKTLISKGLSGKVNSGRRPKHARFIMGSNAEEVKSNIEVALHGAEVDIKIINPADYSNGSYSGKYSTYVATLLDDARIGSSHFPKGTTVTFVNNVLAKGEITGKLLTPTGLNLSQDHYFKTKEELVSEVSKLVHSKFSKNQVISDCLSALAEEIRDFTSKYHFDSIVDLSSLEEEIPYTNKVSELLKSFDSSDVNTIGKDFGEILGAIYLLNIVNCEFGVKFPKGNYPLIDFFVDGSGISSKYKKGAAPTLSGIVKNIDPTQLTTENQKKLLEVLKIAQDSKVAVGYFEIAKFLKTPGYEVLEKIIGKKDLKLEDVNEHIKSLVVKGKDNFDSEAFFSVYDEFYRTIGKKPQNNKITWSRLEGTGKYYGAVVGPISYHVIDTLNADPIYKDSLVELLSMLEVKQLYMDFILKRESISFHLKSFSGENSNFQFEAPNQSVYNPDNGKLGFAMI